MDRNIGSVAVLACVLAASGCSSDGDRNARFSRGNDYAARAAYREAAIEYRAAIQIDPRFGQARAALARTYEQLGDFPAAMREAARAADLMPDDVEAQVHAGVLLLLSGQFEDATARARQALRTDPAHVDALVLLGKASAQLRDSDTALGTLEEAVHQLPAEPRVQQSLGTLQAARGNRAAAEAAFKRAVQLAPQSVEVRRALATYYWSAGDKAAAEQTLREALPFDGAKRMVTRDLAAIAFLQGRAREAEAYLRELLQAFPGESAFQFALGDVYLEQQKFDEAIQAYSPLVRAKDASGIAHARTAYADHRAGRRERAYDRLENALRDAPKDVDLHTMAARLRLRDLEFARAESAAKAALEVDANRYEALYVLATALIAVERFEEALAVLKHAATVEPRGVGVKIQLGNVHLHLGEPKTAQQFAQDALNLAPADPLARLLLVRALAANRDPDGAERVLRPMLPTFASSPQVQCVLGELAVLKRDRTAARRAYARALQLDPASIDAYVGLANLAIAEGHLAEAASLASRALTASPESAAALTLAGQTYLAVQDTRRAESSLLGAINRSPGSVPAYQLLASLYFKQGRLDEAMSQFQAVAAKSPSAIGPPTMIGIILVLQNRLAEAQKAFESLVASHPNAHVAANNLAMLLLQSGGNVDLALNYAQAAKKGLPNDPDVNDTLGLVYLKKGLPTLAIPPLEQSTRVRSQAPEFWVHLGQAYAGAGDKSKARDAFRRAISIAPDSKAAPEAKRMLQALQGT